MTAKSGIISDAAALQPDVRVLSDGQLFCAGQCRAAWVCQGNVDPLPKSLCVHTTRRSAVSLQTRLACGGFAVMGAGGFDAHPACRFAAVPDVCQPAVRPRAGVP
jgi:hypothetical protein